ncbi:MAG: DUF5916 domain-containing protein [bacterium]
MNPFTRAGIFILIVVFLPCYSLFASDPLKPIRVTTPPVIDGVLNDAMWKNAPTVTNFKTFAPDFGKDASQRTIGYMAYDAENLYFAFHCSDTEANKIKTSVTSRDKMMNDDWVCINLDSFNDRQSLYALYVNPFGVQGDSRYAANVEDFSADIIWYSAGKLTDDGYSIEIQIPLKSLRYSDNNPTQMSIFFERYISRLSEHSSYPELKAELGMAFLTQMKPLLYYNLKPYMLFEVLPALTYSQHYTREKNKLASDENRADVSLTAKYGLTSDLILDGTYNPDFSQIEADAGQVDLNLRYQLYFPEKRPFFLEGRESFQIGSTQSSELDPIISLVHTRTIINPVAGIKLTGKVTSNDHLSILYARDELNAPLSSGTAYSHVPAIRYKRALADESYIGGILTSRELDGTYNRVGGTDGILRIGSSRTLGWHLLGSSTLSSSSPDRFSGYALGAAFLDNTRDLDLLFSMKKIDEHFQADMGYITRTGILMGTALIRPKLYPQSSIIQRIDAEAFSAQTKDLIYNQWETFNHLSAQFLVWGSLSLKAKYSYATEIFSGQRFETGGYHLLWGGQFHKQFRFSVLYRYINAIYYSASPSQGKSNRVTAALNYQPTDELQADLSLVFSDFIRSSDNQRLYDYTITRGKITYQFNRYLFLRGIAEYNNFRKQLITDFLASFTYIPGTVVHAGYGSLYQRLQWEESSNRYNPGDTLLEMQRGFFFKMSYLWRL